MHFHKEKAFGFILFNHKQQVVGSGEKMRQYRRVLTVQKENVPSTIRKTDRLIQRYLKKQRR